MLRSNNTTTVLKVCAVVKIMSEGFSKTFEQRHISSVQFELGMVNIYSKFLLKDFWDLFTRYDFVLGPIMPRAAKL
jgi:hypothetical protein